MMPFCTRLRGDGLSSLGLSSYILVRKVVTWWFLQSSPGFLREFWVAEQTLSFPA
jgi:hypothetical protein